ncbi:LysR family transcriptional regulator [bacterium]|nr:LysR family transcriptional regulator [bacterium]
MSLQKYTAFLKTVELGSLSLAAEQMGYTQPAVSRMIQDLEREWGMELLHRSRAGVELSSVGQHLLPLIRSIVADCEELEFAINELHGLHTGLIRVGTFTSVANMWIPSLLVSFQKLYPGIEFTLMNSENYSEIEDWIQHGKIDCGFVNLPTVTDLQVRFLKRDTLVAVLPPDHPMAESPVFPIAQLQDELFIKLKEDTDNELSHFLSNLARQPKVRYEVNSDHMILSMVESGLGISVMHSLLADMNRYNVVWKRFDLQQHRDIGIATAKHAKLSSAVKLFVAHVEAQIGLLAVQ